MASSYFIPLSISAKATSTGALQHKHTQIVFNSRKQHHLKQLMCVRTFNPSQQEYHLIDVRTGLQLYYVKFMSGKIHFSTTYLTLSVHHTKLLYG